MNIFLQSAAALMLSLTQPTGDAVPDFSGVGYHYGEREIPEYKVNLTLEAPSDGSDATSMIQSAIEKVKVPGAILLKAGVYNVSRPIFLDRSGVVLRGEGDSTVIFDRSCKDSLKIKKISYKLMRTSVITVGSDAKREIDKDSRTVITDQYVPVGATSFKVANARFFKPGDRIVVYRPGTEAWIHDIRMDALPQKTTEDVKQWKPEEYDLYWERRITAVKGRTVCIDCPVVMALDASYSPCSIMKCNQDRIEESGVENILFDTEYNHTTTARILNGRENALEPYPADEKHCWRAITVTAAENCWVKGVKNIHFCNCCVTLADGAYHVTVQECTSLQPISQLTGMRRYAFHNSGGECCIIKDCTADEDRHGFVVAARTPGPNVFLRCTLTHAWSDCGPHQRWATGFLYDNVTTDGLLGVTDGSNTGSGHGWRGANFVLWNCESAGLAVQSPWKSAVNWCVGGIGEFNVRSGKDADGNMKEFVNTQRPYDDGLDRPRAVFVSHGTHVKPASLYEYQLEIRLSAGNILDK